MTESDTISSNISDNSLSKAPGAQLSNHQSSVRVDPFVFNNIQQQEEDALKAVSINLFLYCFFSFSFLRV